MTSLSTPAEAVASIPEGVHPIVPHDLPVTEPPTAEQIRLIRLEIDPDGMYAG
jgi:hypothetical protein